MGAWADLCIASFLAAVDALECAQRTATTRANLRRVAWPDAIDTALEVEIETRRGEDAPVHRTIIWAVVDDGDVFVRSLRGTSGRWYRELLSDPAAVLHAQGERFSVQAVQASDPDSVERTSEALRRKYSDSRSLASMLDDDILDTTVRLEPR